MQTQRQGTRRHGSEEAPPIDWIIPPGRRQLTVNDHAMSEVFAFHSVTVSYLGLYKLSRMAQPGLLQFGSRLPIWIRLGYPNPACLIIPLPAASILSQMANTLKTSLVVFTRKGNMPALLSHYRHAPPGLLGLGGRSVARSVARGFAHVPVQATGAFLTSVTHSRPPKLCRPDYPIYCFTENELIQVWAAPLPIDCCLPSRRLGCLSLPSCTTEGGCRWACI